MTASFALGLPTLSRQIWFRLILGAWLWMAVGTIALDSGVLAQLGSSSNTGWVVVNGTTVNVRSGPETNFPIMTSYESGQTLHVLKREAEWAYIQDPETGDSGWMHSDFLSNIPKPSQAKRPSTSGKRTMTQGSSGASRGKKYRMFVYGDSLATNLFEGLRALQSREGFYQVLRQTRGATGLVRDDQRDDQYDWYELMKGYLRRDRPDIIAITFGGNDRQDFQSGTQRIKRFTPSWWREYRRRVHRMMTLLKSSTPHVYWLGLPILRSRQMTADYAKFNKVYREVATEVGVNYVDTWGTFQDASGGYSQFGTGVNGTRQNLRHSDGIHFSLEGCKVLGKEVIDDIRRDFKGGNSFAQR